MKWRTCAYCSTSLPPGRGTAIAGYTRPIVFCDTVCQQKYRKHGKSSPIKRSQKFSATTVDAADHPWNRVPGNILWELCNYLDGQDIVSCSRVCKTWAKHVEGSCTSLDLVLDSETAAATACRLLACLPRPLRRVTHINLTLPANQPSPSHILTCTRELSLCTQLRSLCLDVDTTVRYSPRRGRGTRQNRLLPPVYYGGLHIFGGLTALTSLQLHANNFLDVSYAALGLLDRLVSLVELVLEEESDSREAHSSVEDAMPWLAHEGGDAFFHTYHPWQGLTSLQRLVCPHRCWPRSDCQLPASLTSLELYKFAVEPYTEEGSMVRYFASIGALPNLRTFTLTAPTYSYDETYTSLPSVFAQNMGGIPELHLLLPSSCKDYSWDHGLHNFDMPTILQLASLSGLVELEVTITQCEAEWINELSALSALTRLRIETCGQPILVIGPDTMLALAAGWAKCLRVLELAMWPGLLQGAWYTVLPDFSSLQELALWPQMHLGPDEKIALPINCIPRHIHRLRLRHVKLTWQPPAWAAAPVDPADEQLHAEDVILMDCVMDEGAWPRMLRMLPMAASLQLDTPLGIAAADLPHLSLLASLSDFQLTLRSPPSPLTCVDVLEAAALRLLTNLTSLSWASKCKGQLNTAALAQELAPLTRLAEVYLSGLCPTAKPLDVQSSLADVLPLGCIIQCS